MAPEQRFSSGAIAFNESSRDLQEMADLPHETPESEISSNANDTNQSEMSYDADEEDSLNEFDNSIQGSGQEFDPNTDIYEDETSTQGPDHSHIMSENSRVLEELELEDLPRRTVSASSSKKSSPILQDYPSDSDKENEDPRQPVGLFELEGGQNSFLAIDEPVQTHDRQGAGRCSGGSGSYRDGGFGEGDEDDIDMGSDTNLNVPNTRRILDFKSSTFPHGQQHIPGLRSSISSHGLQQRSISLEELTTEMRQMKSTITNQQTNINGLINANQGLQDQVKALNNAIQSMAGGIQGPLVTRSADPRGSFVFENRFNDDSQIRRAHSENALPSSNYNHSSGGKKRKPLGGLGGVMGGGMVDGMRGRVSSGDSKRAKHGARQLGPSLFDSQDTDDGQYANGGHYASMLDMSGPEYVRNFGSRGTVHQHTIKNAIFQGGATNDSYQSSAVRGGSMVDNEYEEEMFDAHYNNGPERTGFRAGMKNVYAKAKGNQGYEG